MRVNDKCQQLAVVQQSGTFSTISSLLFRYSTCKFVQIIIIVKLKLKNGSVSLPLLFYTKLNIPVLSQHYCEFKTLKFLIIKKWLMFNSNA